MVVSEKIAVIGLGYVGLPLAVALSKHFQEVVGYDVSDKRITELLSGIDVTREVDANVLGTTSLTFTNELKHLSNTTFFIVAVPTPIDSETLPDLLPLQQACEMLGPYIKKGDVIVFESTVYPGTTEEFCGPILSEKSRLKAGVDFFLGYSPERINPGDKVNSLETITKIISAQDAEALKRMRGVYEVILGANLYEAPSINVAEMAKVIENTQRDLNIAFMNEVALICHCLSIKTSEVLAAAGTKWNFLPFKPGLVGGHCIGVDPYYLTYKAEQSGYKPDLILAGRRLNDGMGPYIAERITRGLLKPSKVGLWGLTFKENIPDVRNSKSFDIYSYLREHGHDVIVHDPAVSSDDILMRYKISLSKLEDFWGLDALIVAVAHDEYRAMSADSVGGRLRKGGILADVKSVFNVSELPQHIVYWSL